MADVLQVTDDTFEAEVTNSELPVLVDFWAPWCGPCRMVAPVVEAVAGKYAGKLKVVKVNVDDSPASATKFGIRSIPTLAILKGGTVQDQIIGAVGEDALSETIDKVLA
ncbi:MAG: thioredoxin [Armatimonadetes bacterium]|nr:thioredoxin [Armatimonadota bacterium]